MQNTSLARKAGIIGMVGAALWIISVIMQNSLGLIYPESVPLFIVHELMALISLTGMIIGFLGLIWGGAFSGRLGIIAVVTHALGYGLIVLGGVLALLIGDSESPLFLVFPIGSLFQGIAAILIAIAVITTGRSQGWRRWMPLIYSIYHIVGISLPLLLGFLPDGPGMTREIFWGVSWFLVALAVYLTSFEDVPSQSPVIGQV